jgi:hypothetical protein
MEPAREATSVRAPATVSPPKSAGAAAKTSGYQSNSGRQAPAGSERALSFLSAAFTPSPGLDPALRARADRSRAEGRPFVYGFSKLRGSPYGEVEGRLARLGVGLLGAHDSHQRARVPVESVDAVARLADVEWLTASLPEQRLSVELRAVHSHLAGDVAAKDAALLPIVVNLFEADVDGSFRQQLEAAGAVVADYDASLHFYRAVATRSTIERIIDLDFVLFVELILPGGWTRAARSSTPT